MNIADPEVIRLLYAQAKKTKAERELELMRAASFPHMEKRDRENQVTDRVTLIHSSHEFVYRQTEEDKRREKERVWESNRKSFLSQHGKKRSK